MTTADTLPPLPVLAAIAVLCDPAPCPGYGWQVEEQLAQREAAAQALHGAAYGTREWLTAATARDGAEARLATLLNVKPQPPAPLPDVDAGLFAEQYTCEACSLVGDEDQFRGYLDREIDDVVCDDCLVVQRDAADADRSGARAYYYR